MVPKGTTEYFVDNWLDAKSAKHPDAAYAWINWMLDPKIAAREMNFIGYLCAGHGHRGHLAKDLANDPSINIPNSALARYQSSAPTPKFLELATEVYNDFKAA